MSHLVPIPNLSDIHGISRLIALPHNICIDVRARFKIPGEGHAHTGAGGGNSCRDSSAQGHDSEGKERDDVSSVHCDMGDRIGSTCLKRVVVEKEMLKVFDLVL